MGVGQSSVEKLVAMSFQDFYRGKRVFVTGHTGFKGAWLCEWLLSLGAEVTGFALASPTQPSLFEQLALAGRMTHLHGDIREPAQLTEAIRRAQPQVLFHLAAQSLVRYSYQNPVETYATNVMGTVHVLEALRATNLPCTAILITTDKCYENREWLHGYREEDPMGGFDPYSSSKGAAELVISAYRRSYFSANTSPTRVASARAGNVIGGGDWAPDRIVPDCIRALARGEPVIIRNKTATRPWQHVLEPLSGYLWLGASLGRPAQVNPPLASGFNFGPELASNRTVASLVEEVLKHWPGSWLDRSDPHAPHEAGRLNLATDKAFHLLEWKPVWDFSQTIEYTAAWYREQAAKPQAAGTLTRGQIAAYVRSAQSRSLAWASPAPSSATQV